ncbi:NAD(P)-dependent oxidoreductase [Variovorax paradoxus]|nr:NAD(P)-dependent oxidoreductase [Variovorax paradoxus]
MENMKIGYVGLGALGKELARRFLQAHELCVWDIDAAAVAELEKQGATGATSAAEVARRCDVVLLCLPRSSDVRQAILGSDGLAEGLSVGQLVIDQTSGSPSEMREIAQQLMQRGIAVLDAVVSASPQTVSQGSAILMVGGATEVYERALPVLREISPAINHCGRHVGDGQAMKLINDAMEAGCRLGTLELVAMGTKAGLALECMTEVLNKGGGRNRTTEQVLPAIAQGRSSTSFPLSTTLQSINQAVSLAMEMGTPMPVTSVVRGLLQAGANMLGASASIEDVIGLIELMAGTRLTQPVEIARSNEPVATRSEFRPLTVGYVGLGAMGGALARRLSLSMPLQVFDADAQAMQRHAREEMTAAADLPALARSCDVILLCLPTSAIARQALFGPSGLVAGLSAGKIIVDQTSGDPAETRRLAAELRALGVSMVDAPVSGGPSGAAAGTIAIMTGGAPAAVARVRPVLAAISSNIVHCGDIGNGHTVKLVNNGVSSLCRLVTYECVAAGMKYGLRLQDMAEVLNKSSGWSVPSQKLLPALVAGKSAANFQLQLMVKDLRLAAGLGMTFGVPMTISNVVRNLFEVAVNRYGRTANIEMMASLYESMAGIEYRAV